MNHFLTEQLEHQVLDAGSRSIVFQNFGPPPFVRFDGPGPMFLDAPGQSVGTVGALVADGHTSEAAVIASDGDRRELSPKAFEQLSGIGKQTLVRIDLDGLGDYKLVNVAADDGRTVVAGLPMAGVTKTLLSTFGFFSAVAATALILATAAGIVIIRRQFAPLSRVAAAAYRVAQLELDRGEVDLPTPLVPVDPDSARTEVGQLGSAFNQMLDRIADALAVRHASETRVRQFVADASHELRTPLASIRGYTELARRRLAGCPDDLAHAIERVDAEIKRMTQLVEDMLLLARMDAGRLLDYASVDLSELTVDAVSDAHIAGPPVHRWSVNVPDEPVLVTADRLRVHQMLANLLTNARVHTPPGPGGHHPAPTRKRSGGLDGDRQRARNPEGPTNRDIRTFRPRRLIPVPARREHRLGLAIVRALVKAHDGTIEVQSVPGKTSFAITLPAIIPD